MNLFTIGEVKEILKGVEKCKEEKGIDVIPEAAEKAYLSSKDIRNYLRPVSGFFTIFGLPARFSPEILLAIYVRGRIYENF